MVITSSGIAVLDAKHDMLLSRWVERDGSLDAYDSRIRKVFAPMIPEGGWAVDGGAFLGSHTVAYADAVGPKGRVMAFEPMPSHFECLKFNTRYYHYVRTFPFALYEEERDLWIVPNPYNAGASVIGSPEDTGAIPVHAVHLDGFDFPRLDFIKLDVEGLVLRVLEGATGVIHKYHPVVVVEAEDNLALFGDTVDDVISFMAGHGYTGCPSINGGDHDIIFTVKE